MNLDDEICLCFHVSKRKIVNFLRVNRPRRASQLSECFGAGTGCGWCRRVLDRYFELHAAGRLATEDDPLNPTDHAAGRADHIRAGHGTPPPGGAPLDPPQ